MSDVLFRCLGGLVGVMHSKAHSSDPRRQSDGSRVLSIQYRNPFSKNSFLIGSSYSPVRVGLRGCVTSGVERVCYKWYQDGV